MNRLALLAAAVALSIPSLFVVSPAAADTATLEGGCEYRGGIDCKTSCTNLSFDAICNADLSVSCQGQCSAAADVSCTASCQGSCKATCDVDPGKFTCKGQCTGQCGATCDAKCSASTNGATSQADCKAKCQACCNGSCEGTCSGTPPSATCDARCQASCSGDCRGEANVACQVDCQSKGFVQCKASYTGSCSTKCDSQGVVVCNGAAREFVDDVKAALDWVKQHVTFSGDSQASCSGNTCQASASGQASTKCAATPGEQTGDGLLLGGMGVAAVAFVVGRRRRRAR